MNHSKDYLNYKLETLEPGRAIIVPTELLYDAFTSVSEAQRWCAGRGYFEPTGVGDYYLKRSPKPTTKPTVNNTKPLTEVEITNLHRDNWCQHTRTLNYMGFARAIEAHHKIGAKWPTYFYSSSWW